MDLFLRHCGVHLKSLFRYLLLEPCQEEPALPPGVGFPRMLQGREANYLAVYLRVRAVGKSQKQRTNALSVCTVAWILSSKERHLSLALSTKFQDGADPLTRAILRMVSTLIDLHLGRDHENFSMTHHKKSAETLWAIPENRIGVKKKGSVFLSKNDPLWGVPHGSSKSD